MPPKSKSSDPPPQFFFVNEDATTVTRVTKDPILDREKQSHVQKHNFAKRKQLKEQDKPITFALYPKPDTSGAAESTWLDEDVEWPTFDAYTLKQPVPHSSSQVLTNHSSRVRRRTRKSSPPDPNFSLVHTPTQGRTLHPLFSGSAQILEKWAPPLIEYFNTVVIPEKFPVDAIGRPLTEIRHAAAIHHDCSLALTAPVHLYSFLAEASSRMLTTESKLLLPDLKDEDFDRVPLFFKTKALAALRKALTGGVTLDIVTDVSRIVSASCFAPQFEVFEPHFDALVSMIDMFGGLEKFSHYFQETVVIMDWAAGLRVLKPPRLAVNWDPGQGTPAIAEIVQSLDSQHIELGQRMLSVIEEQHVRNELAQIFRDLVQVIIFRRWTMEQKVSDPEHARYALLRHTAVGSRLLYLGKDVTKGNNHEAFRIAMIFWTALTRAPGPGKRCSSKGTGHLRDLIQSLSWESWASYYDWLLWIAVVGGLAAKNPEEIDYFATVADKAAKALNNGALMDLAEMEGIMTSFLYEPSLQLEPLLEFRSRMRKVGGDSPRMNATV